MRRATHASRSTGRLHTKNVIFAIFCYVLLFFVIFCYFLLFFQKITKITFWKKKMKIEKKIRCLPHGPNTCFFFRFSFFFLCLVFIRLCLCSWPHVLKHGASPLTCNCEDAGGESPALTDKQCGEPPMLAMVTHYDLPPTSHNAGGKGMAGWGDSTHAARNARLTFDGVPTHKK